MPDAIKLLKEDHKKVRTLLEELEKTTDRAEKKRQKLLEEIELELQVHSAIEEEIFYPAFKHAAKRKDDTALYYEAREEHHVVNDVVVPELDEARIDSPEFAGKAHLLKELVQHHVEEEERELFPRAKELFSKHELAALGEKMEHRKLELMQRAA